MKHRLKQIYPNYNEDELEKIIQCFEKYDVSDEVKICLIVNLHRLANMNFNNFLQND
jgi:hypothetical protein